MKKTTKKIFNLNQLQILKNVIREEIKKETNKKTLEELKNIYTDLHINNN
jgi:hypothetical protein|tara:strand:+ start:102 stop:251 length:150 start_codon:yes stop_codon:yes gene_type:complete